MKEKTFFQFNPREKKLRRDLRKAAKSETDPVKKAEILAERKKIYDDAEKRALARMDAREQAQPSETAFQFRPIKSMEIDLRTISDIELRELFAKGKFFRKMHVEGVNAPATLEEMDFHVTQNDIQNGTFSTDSAISKIEQEIRRRNLPMYWRVKSPKDVFVYADQQGNVINDLTDHVYMGEVDLPHLIPVPEPPPAKINPKSQVDFTLTTPQKYSREHWQNQWTSADEQQAIATASQPPAPAPVPVVNRTRAYQLYDGTRFFEDGQVFSEIPNGCTVFPCADPPGYKQNSHVIPANCIYDPLISAWRRR